MEVSLGTGRGVFEILAHVCRSYLEAFRQFAENSTDAIVLTGRRDGAIRICLVREEDAVLREVVLEDNGIGMDPGKMQQVMRSIGQSEKVDLALRGEKGIGILAFALIAREVHMNSASQDGTESACLVLRQQDLPQGRGEVLTPCPLHHRQTQGTTVHLMGILPEVGYYLTRERLNEYLGREFASDLRTGLYTMVLEDGGRRMPVAPQHYRGVRLMAQNVALGSMGHASVELYFLPLEAPDTSVGVYGRGGLRICSLSGLEAFQRPPWQDRRLEGYVRCDLLKCTADKTAIVQDRVYWELVTALKTLELRLRQEVTRAIQEHRERRLGRVLRRVDSLVERFIHYLEEGTPLRVAAPRERHGDAGHANGTPPLRSGGNGTRRSFQPIHFQLMDPTGQEDRWQSWENGGQELVHVNQEHGDLLEAEQDESRCARYLFALWAKEHLLAEYGSDSRRIAEQLVSWLNKAEPLLTRAHPG